MIGEAQISQFIEDNSPLPSNDNLSSEDAQTVYEMLSFFHENPENFDSGIWRIFGDFDGYGVFQHVVFAHETLSEEARKSSILKGLTSSNRFANGLACAVLATFPDPDLRQEAARFVGSDDEEVHWRAEMAVEAIDAQTMCSSTLNGDLQ